MDHLHPVSHRRFVRTRSVVFAIVLVSFVLSFVHRTAPAAIATDLAQAFAINAAQLGSLAATYFYVYMLLQVPVGVLADTAGPRKLLTGGSLVAGAGSLVFALAPTFAVAAIGRTLVGVGVSVAFIAILKVNAVWFAPRRFATVNGITMFAGNLGAVLAGAPLAWLLTQVTWRTAFVGLGICSLALGIASWLLVRDRPEAAGFAPVNPSLQPSVERGAWKRALAGVLRNPQTWPGVFVNAGIAGSYLAFAGLWAVPWLVQTRGMSRVVAAEHASAMLLGVAIGAVVVGWLSDHLQRRAGLMRLYAVLCAGSWLPLLLGASAPVVASIAWFFLMGVLMPGFTLTWTIAKEVNRPEHSGMATSIVNAGIFLGTGILQPLVGWTIDRGRESGDLAQAWQHAIAILAGAAALGALLTFAVREPSTGPVRGSRARAAGTA